MTIDLGTVATVLGITAIVVPAGIASIRLIERRQKKAIHAFAEELAQGDLIAKLGQEMVTLSQALQAHMASEETTSTRIEALGNQLVTDIAAIDRKNTNRVLSLAKSIAGVSEVPTLIHRVWKGGYSLEWANDAYLHLIGLTMDEAQSGGWWLSIDEKERDLVKAASEDIGQSEEDWQGEYVLVHARTQEPIGRAVARGYVIPGNPDEWHYVSQIRVLPLTPAESVE